MWKAIGEVTGSGDSRSDRPRHVTPVHSLSKESRYSDRCISPRCAGVLGIIILAEDEASVSINPNSPNSCSC